MTRDASTASSASAPLLQLSGLLQILLTNASAYSKGILSEILEFVMGTGLIPADGEVWKVRRRCARLASRGRRRPPGIRSP